MKKAWFENPDNVVYADIDDCLYRTCILNQRWKWETRSGHISVKTTSAIAYTGNNDEIGRGG